jgi:hypothetical protein
MTALSTVPSSNDLTIHSFSISISFERANRYGRPRGPGTADV